MKNKANKVVGLVLILLSVLVAFVDVNDVTGSVILGLIGVSLMVAKNNYIKL